MNCASVATEFRSRRGSRSIPQIVALIVLLTAIARSTLALDVPFLSGRVNDIAGMLTPAALDQAERILTDLEREKGSQVALLTIATLAGEPLEDYSLRVAETWKLGRGKFDDGALLLIVRDDRKMRIEVGYGLEPHLTDATTGRILNDVIRPRFRAGDMSGGVLAGVVAIAGVVRGQDVLPPPSDNSGKRPMAWDTRFSLLFVAAMFAMQALAAKFPWGIYLLLSPFLYWLGGSLGRFIVLSWLVGFPPLWFLLRNSSLVAGWRASQRSSGSWRSGGGSGGGWSSGGGFSGGGGSFGGGGASSSW